MTIEEQIEGAVRRVLREELRALREELQGLGAAAEKPATYSQAAKFAECSASTIQGWVKSGLLPATGKGKLRRVHLADVAKVLAGMRSAPMEASKPKSRAAEILASTGGNVRRIR